MSGQESRLRGRWGEEQAAGYLRRKGFQVTDVNWKCRFGEIDLIVEDGVYLCFVEVKLRKNDRFGAACEAVTASKQRKLRAAAEYYLMCHPTKLQPRFDVAEVYAPKGIHTARPEISYIENAF